MSPAVSIIVPVYNRSEFCKRALRSVMLQTCRDFEVIIIDDGSLHAVSLEGKFCSDPRFRVVRITRTGVAGARNRGVWESRAPLIAFLDSDDEWSADKLKRQLEDFYNSAFLIHQTDERWMHRGRWKNKKKYHTKKSGYLFSQSLDRCAISPSAVLMCRRLFEEFGGFDEKFGVCEDYELWLRITAKYHVGLLREQLVTKHGGHEDQLSQSEVAMDRFRVVAMIKLLKEANLTEKQEREVRYKLMEKLKILSLGAQKRISGKWDFDKVKEIVQRRDYDIVLRDYEESLLESYEPVEKLGRGGAIQKFI